jgi:hypothetical protein
MPLTILTPIKINNIPGAISNICLVVECEINSVCKFNKPMTRT